MTCRHFVKNPWNYASKWNCTFFFTHEVPKAIVCCCIKKLLEKWPADILWKTHEIMLRNEVVRFFDHLSGTENDSSLLRWETPPEVTCRHFMRTPWNYASKWSCTFCWSLTKCRKRQFVAALRNSPRSDLLMFCEKLIKSCFEITLYVFCITYEIPKATVRWFIKKVLWKWPAEILWKPMKLFFEMKLYVFSSLMQCRKGQFVAALASPPEWPAEVLWKPMKLCFEVKFYVFFITYAVPKTTFRCCIKNALGSDLPSFCENPMRPCFKTKLYVFLRTYAVPKAAVRCCIKNPPTDVTWLHFVKNSQNHASKCNCTFFFHHLGSVEIGSSLLQKSLPELIYRHFMKKLWTILYNEIVRPFHQIGSAYSRSSLQVFHNIKQGHFWRIFVLKQQRAANFGME